MNKLRKREVIKNIAIVFLVIMLILTFFSNTIMNRTLPEVSTQNVTSGTVTSQVRGEGVVEAEDPYNLVVDETRKVKSVVKHVGDHVEIGDVIYNLEGEPSEELTTAKNELETTKSDYELAILESGLSRTEVAGVEAGVTATTSAILGELEAKDNEINSLKSKAKELEEKIADIEKQIELLGYSNTDTNTEKEEKAVEDAEKALESSKEALQNAEDLLNSYINAKDIVDKKTEALNQYNEAKAEYEEACGEPYQEVKDAFYYADNEYEKAKADYYQKSDLLNITPQTDPDYERIYREANEAKEMLDEAQKLREEAEYDLNEYKKELDRKKSIMDSALQTYNEAAALDVIVPTEEEMNKAKSDVEAKKADVAAKEAALKKAKDNLSNKKSSGSSNDSKKNDLEKQKIELKSQQTQNNSKLETIENERKEYLTNEQTKINLEKKYQAVLLAEKKVKDLEAKALGGEVKSPVAGEITSVAYTAGEKIEAGSTVAVIQIEGKGFKVSFPVSAKQAKSVKVGDEVSIENSWYYGDLTANLVAIQPDKSNSRDGKILVFSLSGESVTPGQNLTLSVGQKSSNYDLIVPLSSLHEDNNGKFILIVDTKSTPFGSRYIAKRVDVKVLAEDDKVAAIDAELFGYEYVITNSSKDLANKDQVKLAD